MNKNKIVKILNICFFIIVLAVTFYFIFKKNNINYLIKNLTKVNPVYLILAILCMIVYISCEGINIRRVLKTLGQKISFISSFKYAAVGFFFSAITPSATGGDPAQLYFMSSDEIKISHGALALLVELCSFQLIVCLLSLMGFIINFDIILNTGHLKYLTFAGLGINILFILFLIIMIFSKTVALKLLEIVCKILKFFSYKKTEKFKEKSLRQIEEYHNCSKYLINNKKTLIKILLTTLIELILYHSVPYLIALSFGIPSLNPFKIITLSAVLYTTVAFIPSPGAMGISEGTFIIMYKLFFPVKLLTTAMIISRAVSYYLFVITCGILIIMFIISKKLKDKKMRKIAK